MKRETELRRQLGALRALDEAVRALRSLSAHHFRATRGAVEPASTYRMGIERICGWSGAELPGGSGGAGLIVLGGELGLCGNYNARVVDTATTLRAELGLGPTVCVGHRAGSLLARRNVPISRHYAAPTSVAGITPLLLKLAEDVLTTYVSEQLASLTIVSMSYGGVGIDHALVTKLLPLSLKPAGPAPALRYVVRDDFASASVREWLYITLYEVLLDALASEQGARLVATQSAEKWLSERIATLHRQLAATRREASTQEVLEIATGARQHAARVEHTQIPFTALKR